ncbi:MAG: TRAP transporter substrate-binding protein [Proteobacteria bacterium]|nr:TRAP transporter substrate-binding protein [Pseudomonadota bacterium]
MTRLRGAVAGAGLGLAAALSGWSGAADGQTTTLRVHHFSSPSSLDQTVHLAPWARSVEAAAGGRIAIQIFPAMQLGGKPSDLVRQVEDGVVDIVYTLAGYTPGRFPGTVGLELPFLAGSSAVMSQVAMAFYDRHLRDEYAGLHLVSIHATEPARVHTARRPIRTLEDFRGLKIRVPSRYVGLAIQALGAVPVGMPLPEIYEALARGQVDGMTINWAIIPPVRLHEVAKHHTDVPVYQAMLVTLMNQRSYERLAPELRRAIDDNSGFAYAKAVGAKWDVEAAKARKIIAESGNDIVAVGEAEVARWRAAASGVYDLWVKEMNDKGKDGRRMLDDLLALVKRYGG